MRSIYRHCAMIKFAHNGLFLLLYFDIISGTAGPTPSIVWGVAEEEAIIPCFLDQPLSDGQVTLVMWYRTGVPDPIYTLDARWVPLSRAKHFKSVEVEGRARFDVDTYPPVLRLRPVRMEDEAEYKCRVDLRHSRTLILHVKLKIIVPPSMPIIMDEHGQRLRDIIGPYDEGSPLQLTCEVDGGNPTPAVTWWRGAILLDDSFNITHQGFVRNELTISELQRSDLMSEFTCQASNTNLTKPKTSTVVLDLNLQPLQVSISWSGQPLTAGKKTQVVCQAIGSRPPALISWSLDGKVLPDGGEETISEGGNLTVSILHVTLDPGDNDKVLSCRAENPILPRSAIYDYWTLQVRYAPVLHLTLGASISVSNIREGSDVYLDCVVRAHPPVDEVRWHFEGLPLQGNQSAGLILSNMTLVLQGVRREHRGRYRCLAANSEGQGISNDLYLRVQFAPICKRKMQTYGVARHEVFNAKCDVEADPPEVDFIWALNNSVQQTQLDTGWDRENETKSLLRYVPHTLSGYGLLLCWGRNSVGTQKIPCVYRIVPAGAPESPRDCVVTNESTTSLSVECTAGYDGGLPQVFHLEVYNSAVEHLAWNMTAADAPLFHVRDLPPDTAFVLVLYATNGKGRSDSVALMTSTLSTPAERRTAEEDPTAISPLLILLISAVVVLVLIAGVMVIFVKKQGSKEAEKENESTEDTRSRDSFEKAIKRSQDTSEKGPDIIPFTTETEVYFSGISCEDPKPDVQKQKIIATESSDKRIINTML